MLGLFKEVTALPNMCFHRFLLPVWQLRSDLKYFAVSYVEHFCMQVMQFEIHPTLLYDAHVLSVNIICLCNTS